MNALPKNDLVEQTIHHWKCLPSIIRVPQNDEDYDALATMLDTLLDIIGNNDSHELTGLIETIEYMITSYDQQQFQHIPNATGLDALKMLITQHQLKQADLVEIGSQGVVSEVLSGRRALNIKQIKRLAKRFDVSADTFIN